MPYGTVNADVISTSVANTSLGAGNATRFKNRIINGDMRIDQRNAGASVTLGSGGYFYTLDRFGFYTTAASKLSVQQNAGSVTPPAGFTNYLGVTSLSAYSISASDIFLVKQSIEGYNINDLSWGTADAKTITLSFWVRSSLTGTFGGAIDNANAGSAWQNYAFSYTINVANTWEQKIITIPGPTSGTWNTNNTAAPNIYWGLGVGSSGSKVAGSWNTTSAYSATGATSVVGTNGATWYMTGVQFEVGSSATGFEVVDYGTQFSLCERYFEVLNVPVSFPFACVSYANGAAGVGLWRHRTLKRASPTVTFNPSSNTGRLVFPSNIGGSAGGMQSQLQQTDSVQIASTTTLVAGAGWIDTFIAYSTAEL